MSEAQDDMETLMAVNFRLKMTRFKMTLFI